ncbi:MAG: energy-coupling factor transporter transmembrane protein EcfT [Anaerolineales bacterium]|nr:MAG: energy-coupling factor transporter transmembrane protein EcfT [Anaerolineales bacterium]
MMEYVPRRSLIHNLHPLTKLIWSLIILILALIFNDPWYLAAVVLSVVLVGLIGKVVKETLVYLGAMLLVSGFVFVFQVLFRPGGQVLFTVFPSSWLVVGGWLPVTEGGVLYGIVMSLRMLCIASAFPVILSTTQPRDIVMAMVDTLHVPFDYAFMFTAALRFMPVVMSEVSTISQAQRSRAYAVEGWNPIRKLQAFAPIAMPIVFIAIEKADRLGLCMDLRGYGSEGRTYLHVLKLRFLDWAALTLIIVVIIGSIVAATQGYGRIVIPQ